VSLAPNALEELLALSEAMLGAAESGDWELLASIENQRSDLVSRLPANLAGEPEVAKSARGRRLIEDCQRCDARVRPLVEARLNELRVVLREVRASA
jgi:hypothetical protein